MPAPALSNIKVIEMARILAGPWAGQILADLGAEVIKVESPKGDDTRQWGPPFLNEKETQTAAYFHCCNRGKSSIVVDFKDESQRNKLIELLKTADVLIENYTIGTLKKYGLDYAQISKINPGIVYCSITGFGQDGPAAHKLGYDFIIQGLSGIMDLTGEANGKPQKMGVAFTDIFTGLYSVIAIQAALWQRHITQKGQHIDMALYDCMTGVLANQAMNYLVSKQAPTRLGNRHPNIAPYQTFKTKDEDIIITAGNNKQFTSLCNILELKQLIHDPLYITNQNRVKNVETLSRKLEEKTRLWHCADLLKALDEADIPTAPVNSVADIFSNSQFIHRNMYIEPQGIPGIRTPIRMSAASLKLDKASPQLGQDTKRILDKLNKNNS